MVREGREFDATDIFNYEDGIPPERDKSSHPDFLLSEKITVYTGAETTNKQRDNMFCSYFFLDDHC